MSESTSQPTAGENAAGAEGATGGGRGTTGGKRGGGKAGAEGATGVDATSAFHVVGPGSVLFKGKTHPPGVTLMLTDDDAESLGAAVAPGRAPPPPAEVSKRKAGKYAVAPGGSVLLSGRFRQPGEELDLSEADARSLGASVLPLD
jgi:hypothetical protein